MHHTPASAISPYTHHTGPSVWMETADHVQTGSWGRSKAAQAYRQKQADLIAQGKIRESVQMDIDDIRSKFGNKYNDHIQGKLRWGQTLFSVFEMIVTAGQPRWPKTIGLFRRNEYSPCDVDGSNCSMRSCCPIG